MGNCLEMGIYGKNLEMGKILRDGKIWLEMGKILRDGKNLEMGKILRDGKRWE